MYPVNQPIDETAEMMVMLYARKGFLLNVARSVLCGQQWLLTGKRACAEAALSGDNDAPAGENDAYVSVRREFGGGRGKRNAGGHPLWGVCVSHSLGSLSAEPSFPPAPPAPEPRLRPARANERAVTGGANF
ncbi:hypothetical protein MRX96_015150 [Rhipicephalus microplus]